MTTLIVAETIVQAKTYARSIGLFLREWEFVDNPTSVLDLCIKDERESEMRVLYVKGCAKRHDFKQIEGIVKELGLHVVEGEWK